VGLNTLTLEDTDGRLMRSWADEGAAAEIWAGWYEETGFVNASVSTLALTNMGACVMNSGVDVAKWDVFELVDEGVYGSPDCGCQVTNRRKWVGASGADMGASAISGVIWGPEAGPGISTAVITISMKHNMSNNAP
jgi:hypothetical protein